MRKFLVLIALLALTTPADAHKVIASAWTDGADIEGEVGLSNGDVALEGTAVEVFDLDDNLLGETKIGKEGLFRFTPTKAIPHKFRANLGAGHVATLIMQVDELPDHLKGETAPVQTPSQSTDQSVAVSGDMQKLVAKAVRKEIQPLRKEIASYKEKNDLQTIMGGIGYILGLTGIAFYMAARCKEKKGE
ncbi:hypothetical protein GCM10011332_19420 [Terasakiella brassicae]|uniref:Cobalt ABC transporter permease n=1 Tax=Terasakiella brassicae TaxID=1634917 RepID=A0A917C083_9PROT|nr:cobalt ABC transporter permease [Terasakiella brassicae]GGF65488.1 hypothetical protein GCM10011332_19420 [Terasakiella brassicae]